jgi:glycosyltransferase involved in cell wall biosynthesis
MVFKQFLLFWVKVCATEVIYVSDFLANEEPLNKSSHILWNAIEDNFREKAEAYRQHSWQSGKVLMLASLKRYKGVDEFVAIARACPELYFDLVVNASEKDIAGYFVGQALPTNLMVYPAQRDVHPFYQRADVVMNLSRPEEWKETFGLTALEAMIYGLPVIVPTVGGIAEIVENGLTGFHLNGKDTSSIITTLKALSTDPIYYQFISQQAARHASTFSERHFLEKSLRLINQEKTS